MTQVSTGSSSEQRLSSVPAGLLESMIRQILCARVYDVAQESPLDEATMLSARLKNRILLKREDLQPVFSFKCRGAYNKIVSLPESVLAKGIITASAGNHAQGVALAAAKLGIRALIVMSQTTPNIKVQAVRARGAEVVLYGDNFDEAREHSKILQAEQGLTYIHPYDDETVIAGQGTIAMEVLRQHTGPIEAVFMPVGGGGLIAGMAAYIKYLRPEVRVVGVEPEDSASLAAALAADERVVLPKVGLFADGVAVAQIGEETFKYARHTVDEVITVTTDEICAAVKDIFEDTRSIAEPAGAVAVAGMKKYIEREGCLDKNLVSVVSGANINFDRLRHISERTEFGEHREALFAATIPEQPGAFLQFCQTLGKRSITEFNYRYADAHKAHVFVGVALQDARSEAQVLLSELSAAGYEVADFTDNELAKLHVRYSVGGHAPGIPSEMIFRFIFPERPGALLDFLTSLSQRWNISLFHYRNHGAAYGRVLVGMQVPEGEEEELREALDRLGYRYHDETDNPAYRLFLGA
jgi:threonine dehydratase